MKLVDANLIIIAVYVDDLLVTGSHEKLINEFKVEMLIAFEMADLGLMSFFLGMEVKQDHDGIFIRQKKYARENTQEISYGGLKKHYISNEPKGEILQG